MNVRSLNMTYITLGKCENVDHISKKLNITTENIREISTR